ncbi:MAG: alginate export family protein [Oceanicaulis sp.]
MFTSSLLAAAALAAADGPASPFTFEASTRVRYETLSAPFRAGRTGSDQQLSWRTRASGEYAAGALTFGGEVFDSRAYLVDDGSALSSTMINTLDLLQAYVRVDLDAGELQAGRFVMNVGSRRLVGENSFRNFPNSFEGVRGAFTVTEGWRLDAFYTAPVQRKPGDRASLLDNEQAFDEGDWDTRFWAAHLTRDDMAPGVNGEVYLYGLNEDGGDDLYTLGARLSGGEGAADFDIEAMWQTGETGAGRDVAAAFVYADAGYTFEGAWSPRLSAQLVYASGDDDPLDAEDNRFDPLYGLRRGALGQTGIFGPLDFENIIALGARLEARRGPVEAHVLIQDVRLASGTDRWRRSGLRDGTGASGDRIGQVFDTRLSWWVEPDRWRLEAGTSILFKGEFATDAPGAPGGGDPVYSYVMLTRFF